jgi:hypothetical protein
VKASILAAAALAMLIAVSCGSGGGPDVVIHPSQAPRVSGQVEARGVSGLRGVTAADDLFVRVVVTNPNTDGSDVETIRYCLKYDPNEDSPLTGPEAKLCLDPVPDPLPANIDVQSVGYTGSPQIIEITQFRGAALSPDKRYWISAVFVAPDGVAGPVTPPQRFKLIFRYQLVQPPEIGILKIFEGTVYDHNNNGLANAFVQYFHEGDFLEAGVTDDSGRYYFEVVVPNPEGVSSLRGASCEESDDPTDYILKAYHPYYSQEAQKYLLPEYTHYYVDLCFKAEWHDQGGGSEL